jgi:uncharacterized protein YchJ
VNVKPGRSDSCSCGSGKPYAQCCGQAILPVAESDALIALYNTRRYAELESRARMLSERYPQLCFSRQPLGGVLNALQAHDHLERVPDGPV